MSGERVTNAAADCLSARRGVQLEGVQMLEESDFDVLIRTGLSGPVAIGLAKNLLDEAGIPYFTMDQSSAARQESGNVIGWWSVRVPRAREPEAREILQNVETMR
jgi:hypothetical protein